MAREVARSSMVRRRMVLCALVTMAGGVSAQVPGGSVLGHARIDDPVAPYTGSLDVADHFGEPVAALGDLDGNGVGDLVVGVASAFVEGAVWVLFLAADGTVVGHQQISASQGGFTGAISSSDGFGASVAALGDLDGDGNLDIAVGAPFDNDGGFSEGAVWILFLEADGTVKSHSKISATQGGLSVPPGSQDEFGASIASMGDLDGDGIVDLAVGAPKDDESGSKTGAVWILHLTALGTVAADSKINTVQGGFTGSLSAGDAFGSAVVALDDLDGNGQVDLAVGVPHDQEGAVWILFLDARGAVLAQQKISKATGGFTGQLSSNDRFGAALGAPGDLDGNGIADLAVGAPRDDSAFNSDEGAVWILFLNADGTIAKDQKIKVLSGGFGTLLGDSYHFGSAIAGLGDTDGNGLVEIAVGTPGNNQPDLMGVGAVWIVELEQNGKVAAKKKIAVHVNGFEPSQKNPAFGSAMAWLGDLDGDGVGDLAVGSYLADGKGVDRGGVRILFLDAAGAPVSNQLIDDVQGGFTGKLELGDGFGRALAPIGDLDGDGTIDLAVGAPFDDDGNYNAGAVWILFLAPDGTVKSHSKISATKGGFTGALALQDEFGTSVAALGDVDGDGVPDIAVGAPRDDDGDASTTSDRGAVWILFLNADGTVKAHSKISSTQGGFGGQLSNQDQFGASVAWLGDLDGDGAGDLAVGAPHANVGAGSKPGAVWILFMNSDMTVSSHRLIDNGLSGLAGALNPGNRFGWSLAVFDDLDDDGVVDLAVGAPHGGESAAPFGGGLKKGAVYVLFLLPDGSVSSIQKISAASGNFAGNLKPKGGLGFSLAVIDDFDGDGFLDLAAGAPHDTYVSGGDLARGTTWLLFLHGDRVWADLGNSLAGTYFAPPVLQGSGTLDDGTEFALDLSFALSGVDVFLVVGDKRIDLPFKGGVLVPQPDLVLLKGPTDFIGHLTLSGVWPHGLPSGAMFFFQAWLRDAGGPQTLAASNALRGTTP